MTIDFEKDQEQVIDKTTNLNKLADKIKEMQAVKQIKRRRLTGFVRMAWAI
jgi:hypothetical protein